MVPAKVGGSISVAMLTRGGVIRPEKEQGVQLTVCSLSITLSLSALFGPDTQGHQTNGLI
jgi:hypothetical protein